MPVDKRYRRQVELLVCAPPHVAQERCFAFFVVYLVSHSPAHRDGCWRRRAGICAKSSSAVWPG